MNVMQMQRVADVREDHHPLVRAEIPSPVPGDHEVLVRVSVCGVCHTDLDEIEGRLSPANLPVVPGHQVVGRIEAAGPGVSVVRVGQRVGVAWIYSACGTCRFCRGGEENLCPDFRATGRDVNGGYAPYMVAREDFVHSIPEVFSDVEAAPLLCAGAIGYRSLRLSGIRDGEALGLTGFGASAHLVLKLVKHLFPRTPVYVFARGESERGFARELGAVWTGKAEDVSPEKLRAVIDTTPAWTPVVEALKNLEPGGRLLVNAIRKEDGDKGALLHLDYPAHLWMEKEIKSVANVTRRDVREFLDIAAAMSMKPETEEIPLSRANEALVQLRKGNIKGAKVLRID
jgi:alcohol dehydrogenase, propanol-preferring